MPRDSTHTTSSTKASAGGTGGSNCHHKTSDNTNTSTDAASAPPLTSRPPGTNASTAPANAGRNVSSDNIGSSAMGGHQPQQPGDRAREDRRRRAAHRPHLGQAHGLRGLEHDAARAFHEEPIDDRTIDDPEQDVRAGAQRPHDHPVVELVDVQLVL